MLAFTDDSQWRPGIGDPTLMGWVTVAAYFITAVFCWKSARAEDLRARRNSARSREALFWWAVFCFLFLLGVNKQLDLQTWFTLSAKHVALKTGWYEQRHKRVSS
jgi:hypothetical protein